MTDQHIGGPVVCVDAEPFTAYLYRSGDTLHESQVRLIRDYADYHREREWTDVVEYAEQEQP